MHRRTLLWIAPWALAALAGCLGTPEVEERWTNLELLDTNALDQPFALGGEPLTVDARLTFREILTGEFVAELRASDSVQASMVPLDPEGQPVGTARDVDLILRNSVTAGRDTRTVTGYPQLQRDVHFSFDTFSPPDLGGITGLFLVLYLGDGEEIELEDGRDSLVVTPYFSDEYEILSKGVVIPWPSGAVTP
jgi:hypothetical protein